MSLPWGPEYDEANWLLSAHLPLEGQHTGLVTNGELQELVYLSHDDGSVTAVQRQLSTTMQTPQVQTDVATL